MKKKVIAGLFWVGTAVLAGGGAAWGVVYYMQSASINAGNTTKKSVTKKKVHNGKETFVSLSESVVTLHDADGEDHYMVLELAMIVEDEHAAKTVITDEPLYQSVIVGVLSDMKYEDVHPLRISQIKSILTTALNTELNNRGITVPWTDILVQKVVFQ